MANVQYGMGPGGVKKSAQQVAKENVGPGWVPIVVKLIEDLVAAGWDGRVHQIKEKFGGLRFYADLETEEQRELVNVAERACDKACDVCGAPGLLRQGGWIRTMCDEHAEGRVAFKQRV